MPSKIAQAIEGTDQSWDKALDDIVKADAAGLACHGGEKQVDFSESEA
jgi:hypothetical protein